MPELLKLPYLIDPHVHFRTPGQEHKEDFYTGSRAALAGGVTTVLDMPNNSQLVTGLRQLTEKERLAEADTVCDIGFYLGTMGDPKQDFMACAISVYGLKIYMNMTTGHFVVTDPEKLDNIFRRWHSKKPILVHAEGDRLPVAIALAEKYDRRLYVCHVSEQSQLDEIDRAKNKRPDRVFAEVTPHHLALSSLWSADPYKQMKPPLSDFKTIHSLWEGLRNGTLDVVGTDHAPHTKAEKESSLPPSGVTGLETTLPVLLMAQRAGLITLDRIAEVTHHTPLSIFSLTEEPRTYVEVLRDCPWVIRGEAFETKCHTTPFEGIRVLDKVHRVTLRGRVVYENGRVLAERGSGQVI